MLTCYGTERKIGEIWIDSIDGAKVITVNDTDKVGCKACAFSTFAGGACPGTIYDRHPCSATDRKDGQDVYFKLIHYVPEAKAPVLRMTPFGILHL